MRVSADGGRQIKVSADGGGQVRVSADGGDRLECLLTAEETRWCRAPTSEHDVAWSPNGGEYVLGFASALKFHRSQMFCRPCKSASEETKNEVPRMYTHPKNQTLPLKILQSISEFRGLSKNNEMTQHALEVSESSEC